MINRLKDEELILLDIFSIHIIKKYNLINDNISKIKKILNNYKLNKYYYDFLFYRIRKNLNKNNKLNIIQNRLTDY